MFYRTITLMLCLLWPAHSAAQSVLPAPVDPAAETQADGAAQTTASTQALIDLLQDDAARRALIDQLEASLAPEDAGSPAETPPPGGLGTRVAQATQDGAETLARSVQNLFESVRKLPATLSGLRDATDPALFLDALSDLAFVIVATYAAFLILRLISRKISRRLARQAELTPHWASRVGFALLAAVIDLLVVGLAWATGYFVTIAFHEGFGVIQIRQSLYLNAFLIVELAKVAARAVLAPRFDALRLVPLSRPAAQGVWRWLTRVTSLLGYGLLLAVPIINNSVGYFAGGAFGLVVSALAILLTMNRVRLSRHAVADWLYAQGDPDPETPTDNDAPSDQTASATARLAALWHVPVQLYLAGLLILVLVRPGNVLLPLLQTSAMVLGVILLGVFVRELMLRAARRGVRLPPYLRLRLPTLEDRLNGLLPKVIMALRALLLISVVAVTGAIVSGWNLSAWLASPAVMTILSEVLAVGVIVLAAFVIWLAMSSWVEYQLNPLFGAPPKPRIITLLTLLRNAATIAILIFTTMFVLSEIGLDIGPLLASAGVLGLAIGFGAQKLVQDIITGIFIQFENAMNVGDVVTVGGTTGAVEKLTVRSVSLRDVEGVFHIIPFSSVDMVSNYMRDFSYFLADMGVAYREDIDMAKQAMHDAFDELRDDPDAGRKVLGGLEWFGLNSFGDSAIVLRARIKTIPGEQWGIGRLYNQIVKRVFDERGIEIPFPHQTIYFGEDRSGRAPPLHIRTDASEPPAPEMAAAAPHQSPQSYDLPDHADVSDSAPDDGEGR